MIVIGVTGFRQCGKDSTCKVLQEEYGFTKYAYADALREMAAAVNPVISIVGAPPKVVTAILHATPLSEEYPAGCTAFRYVDILQAVGYEQAKSIPDFRRFLQRLGTEGVRNIIGSNAWVDALRRKIAADAPDRVCISDVRFHNEADWIKFGHGLIWRASRPGHGGDDPHPSEVEIPSLPVDCEFTASTLQDLQDQVRAVADSLGLSTAASIHQQSKVQHGSSSSGAVDSASSAHAPASGSTGQKLGEA